MLSLPLLSYLALLFDSLLVLVIASRTLCEAQLDSPVFLGSAGVGSLSLSLGLYLDDLVLKGLASGDKCCQKSLFPINYINFIPIFFLVLSLYFLFYRFFHQFFFIFGS